MANRQANFPELNNVIDDIFDQNPALIWDGISIQSYDIVNYDLVPITDDWYGVADYVSNINNFFVNANNPYSPPWFD